jgi:hypothetical protein
MGVAPAWVARAAEGQAEVVRRGDRGDDPDLLAVGLEDDPLLDVQLDERVHAGGIDARVLEPIGVEAGLAQRRGHARAVAIGEPVEVGPFELARGRTAAHAPGPEARLLAGPGHDVDRAPRGHVLLAQRAHGLDSPEHAEHAVVGPGVERRVDVRAGDEHRRVWLGAHPAPEEVAHGVEPRLEARAAHTLSDPFERGRVGRRVDLARDPAGLGVVVEPRKRGDGVVQGAHGAEA